MSYEKAYFKDKNDKVFYVQFNPSEMTLAEKATWKTADEKKKPRPKIEYEKGEPTTLKMKLIFDASNKLDSDGDASGHGEVTPPMMAEPAEDERPRVHGETGSSVPSTRHKVRSALAMTDSSCVTIRSPVACSWRRRFKSSRRS